MLNARVENPFLQNPLAYELDRTHPLTPNYGFYIFQNGRVYNFANNDEIETGSNNISYGSDDKGFYVKYDGSSTTYIEVPGPGTSGKFWQVTVLASQTFIDNGTEQAVLALTNSSNAKLLHLYADIYFSDLRLGAYAGNDKYTPADSLVSGQNYTVGLVAEAFASGTNTVDLYIDGSLEFSGNSSYSKFEDATDIYLGNIDQSDNKGANGPQYWVYLHTELRTPTEMEYLSNNIHKLFKPRNQIFHGASLVSGFSPYWVRDNQLIGGGITA